MLHVECTQLTEYVKYKPIKHAAQIRKDYSAPDTWTSQTTTHLWAKV